MDTVSTKPYLLRAIYEWCVDQGYTPYISVVVDSQTRVPMAYVKEGQIVLNIGPLASHQLQMGNEFITFQGRFNGQAQSLSVPVSAVAAIYARENGEGMGFEIVDDGSDENEMTDDQPDPDHTPPPPPEPGRPKLTRVK